ncbi:MAG TPA: tetratricopeptide repeat protein [Edaphocola sp.]|nr:tetratricopeptide repeat protein [Edaphocola sp.]
MNRIEQLKEFLKDKPKDCFLRHALALELIKTGRQEQAKALFKAILDEFPDYIASYYPLGKLLEQMGRPHDALKIYEQGMQQAQKAGDQHTLSELRSAIDLVD